MTKRKVLMIYTGGTIGMEKDYKTGSLMPFDFQYIFEKIPEIDLIECEVECISFDEPLDSSDIGPNQWRKMATMVRDNYDSFDGFLILHGTDTMAYTASALSFMFRGQSKPVILTGSQLPIGDLRTDAKENLLTSLYYASLYQGTKAVIQEVALYFEYKLLRGNRSIKYSAENFDAFRSPNYPLLGQSGVNLKINESALYRSDNQEGFTVDMHLFPYVTTIHLHPAMDMTSLSHYIDHSCRVIILQVYGSGTICNTAATRKCLKEIREKGIEILILSQCISGEISFGKYSNSNIFREVGAINGGGMTLEAALAKSMHIVDNPYYKEDFSTLMITNLRGERD